MIFELSSTLDKGALKLVVIAGNNCEFFFKLEKYRVRRELEKSWCSVLVEVLVCFNVIVSA